MTTKILMGTAVYKTVMAQTFRSAVAVAGDSRFWSSPEYEYVGYAVAEGYGTTVNLERIYDAAAAVVGPTGLLIYHDSDMVFGTDTIESHISAYELLCKMTGHRKHVVAATYRRSYDRAMTVGVRSPADERKYDEINIPGVYEAHSIGFGFVLIPTCVYMEWSRPWAAEEMSMERQYTPDTVFGVRAVGSGASLWINENAPVKHHVTEVL